MKIQTQVNKTSDEISLSGSTLAINGTPYDTTNIQSLKKIGGTEEDPIYESPENQRVYLSGEEKIIFLKVDINRQFMFINGNDKRFYDKDCNNLIDLSELKVIVDHWNMSESDRKIEHLQIKEYFLKTHTLEDWKAKGL